MKDFDKKLAEYSSNLKYSDIKEKVIHETKRKIIDSLGCAIGAFNAEPVKILREIASNIKSKDATILGTLNRTSVDMATFVNGAMIRYLDFMDNYFYNGEYVHPEDNISAILSVADSKNLSGKDVILATVLAYEASCRFVDFANIRKRGWDHVIWISIASSIASSKLLKLSKEKTAQAISLAITSNIPLRQIRVGNLSMWKGLAAAYAARSSVLTSKLAEKGITGPNEIFEGEKGFFKQITGKSNLRIENFCKRGDKFKIVEVNIKKYPVETNALSAVEAAFNVRKKLKNIKNINKINIYTFDSAYEIIADKEKWYPKNRETADHSLPYIVCVALLDGKITREQFSNERINANDLKNLIRKVNVYKSEECNKDYYPGSPNIVEVLLNDGNKFSSKVVNPRGSYKNPMSDSEIEDKFRNLTNKFLSAKKIDLVLDFLWNLEKAKSIKKLFPLLLVKN